MFKNDHPHLATSTQLIMRKFKKLRLLFNLFLFLGFTLTILQFLGQHHPDDIVERQNLKFAPISSSSIGYDRDQSCQFPVLDPFDPSILAYVKHPFPIYCQRVQPEFTFVDERNRLRFDAKLIDRHRFRHVYYRNILRKNETAIAYGNWSQWNLTRTPAIYLRHSVEVYGQYDFDRSESPKSGPKRYRNLHASVHVQSGNGGNIGFENSEGDDYDGPEMKTGAGALNASRVDEHQQPPRDQTNRRRNSTSTTSDFSVLIFGIDSLSRSNFIRNLPRTFAYLSSTMNSTTFRGYTKIDDNTFPNILAVLTGRRVTIHGSELRGHFQHDHVDHYPFVWKNFSAKGYTTGLAEEQPGVLSYKAKGFERQPTDWYLRPFGLAMERSPLRKHSSPYCVGNRAESKIVLEAIERFVRQQFEKGNAYFLFSFLWKLSHDKTYDVEMIDRIIEEFFRRLFTGGYLENTIVFVMSDHGNRFDPIRRTLIGRYEERMPFLSVYLPPRFRQMYPTLVDNLDSNVWRLTCQFDIYETLIDLVSNSGDENRGRLGDPDRLTLHDRGRSLFTRISKTRTCEQAQISPHFCVCQKEENLDPNAKLVQLSTEFVLDEINNRLLQPVKSLCAKLKVKSIISAQKYKASDHVRYAIRWHFNKLLSERNVTAVVANLRVTFSTKPNNAVFEALIQYYESTDQKLKIDFNATTVDISRINAYGNDGDCVSTVDRTLEKFCYCRGKSWFS